VTLGLDALLAQRSQPAYIALLPEMKQANNAYSAFNASGSPRDGSHSTTTFRQGLEAVCVHSVRWLARWNQQAPPGLGPAARLTSQTTLPTPRLAFMWAPQTAGTPDIPANRPAVYDPGSAYVDILGTDFYSVLVIVLPTGPAAAALAHTLTHWGRAHRVASLALAGTPDLGEMGDVAQEVHKT
jgi:hypothetical protein